jgi:hypothetical protein
MNRRHFISVTKSFVVSLVIFSGCDDVQTDRKQGLFAKHHAEMRRLLVALELFRSKNGALPPSLEELQKSDADVRDISVRAYKYSPDGILVDDGTRWLITLPDPKDNTKLMVGRLPVDVAVRKPKQQ